MKMWFCSDSIPLKIAYSSGPHVPLRKFTIEFLFLPFDADMPKHHIIKTTKHTCASNDFGKIRNNPKRFPVRFPLLSIVGATYRAFVGPAWSNGHVCLCVSYHCRSKVRVPETSDLDIWMTTLTKLVSKAEACIEWCRWFVPIKVNRFVLLSWDLFGKYLIFL